jgi:hypothetical protein
MWFDLTSLSSLAKTTRYQKIKYKKNSRQKPLKWLILTHQSKTQTPLLSTYTFKSFSHSRAKYSFLPFLVKKQMRVMLNHPYILLVFL